MPRDEIRDDERDSERGIRHCLKSAANNAGVCATALDTARERAESDPTLLGVVPKLAELQGRALRIEHELRALLGQGMAALRK